MTETGGQYHRNMHSLYKSLVHPGIVYLLGYPRIHTLDNSYAIDNNCNGCGICSNVCPVNNIVLKDNKPQWQNHCELCFACMQWCPKQSIQWGKNTKGVKRYHHPNASAKIIMGLTKEKMETK